jgi:hypothetical protein
MRPVSGPFLKAVVASQDLGAAGTEFERSLISFPCNKNYHFLYDFCAPLSLLFQRQSICLSCHLIPPILSFFIWMPRKQPGPISASSDAFPDRRFWWHA